MQIKDFTTAHVEQATHIALLNYNEERKYVPALPLIDTIPDLIPFAENNLGVAAFEGDKLIGFLCSYGVWNNAWGIQGLQNIFSPMGAHGAIGENRAKIYARLYQAASEKWVSAGASSHAVCLYAHDKEVQEQFFHYGFGVRCVDAIREMDEIDTSPCDDYEFSELTSENILKVLPLDNLLDASYIASPFFMYREQDSKAEFLNKYEHFQSIYFIAEYKGQVIAFIKAELDGETFIKNNPGYLHVKGAYCLPEHRGKGINQKLLNLLVQKLKTQGYTHLGVDFESFNPSGSGFWLKYFTAYTHSVVRRIDENAVLKIAK